MSFLWQLVHGQLDLRGAQAVQFYGCVAGDDCGVYDQMSSANHVIVVGNPLVGTHVPPDGTLRLDSRVLILRESTDPSPAELEADQGETAAVQREAWSAGFCDKIFGLQVTGNESPMALCPECGATMDFLGQLKGADLRGMERGFIAILKLCPRGHAAALDMVRG